MNKFSVMVNNVLGKFNIYNDYDKEDLIKCIIMLMNKAACIENSYPVTLSRDTIEQLNEKGIFDELNKIINSDELRDLYYFGVDGYLDNYNQGATGDCWLIAAITSLNATENGQQVIKDSISQDESGNIVVTFKGIGISYTITPEEMEEARIAPAYSHGDNDILALELATEKLRREITAGKINLRYGNYGGGNDDDGSYGMGIWGGWQNYMIYYLTGNIPQQTLSYPDSEADVMEFLDSIYEDFKTGNFAGYFSLGSKNVEATTTDGRTFNWYEGSYHAFSILSMTEDTITIANPWYPDKPYTFSREEFAKLMPHSIGIVSTKVHEHEYKTSWNNTVDYNATFTINGKEYSLNDILSSDKTILYETNDINSYKNHNNLKNILINIAHSTLSDVEPDIVNEIVDSLVNYYNALLGALYYDDTLSCYFMNGIIRIYSSMAEENGVSLTESGGTIDIRSIVQKLINIVDTIANTPKTLEEFNEKLQGDEFNQEVSQEELNIYLNKYRELLINNYKADNNYDEEFISLLDNAISGSISDITYYSTPGQKFNLKEMLSRIKNVFDELKNSSSLECQTNTLGYSNYKLSIFVNDIISYTYYNNRDYIDAANLYQFKEQLIQYLAEKYGKTEELARYGSFNLSEVIQDMNSDGSWLDEFFAIVKEFSHKDDDKVYGNTVNYDATFEFYGAEYSLNDILSSSEPIILNINDENYTYSIINNLLQQIFNSLHDIQPKLRNALIDTMKEYYYTFAGLCFNEEAFNYGTNVTVYNALKNDIETVWFDSSVAKEYGITKTDEGVRIDLKVFINKLLALLESAIK